MMEVKRFVCNPFQEISYLLYCETKEAVIIDCGCYDAKEQQRIIDFIDRKELKLVKVLNTHLHIDHVAGNAFMKKQYNIGPSAHEGDRFIYDNTMAQASLYGFELETAPPAIEEVLKEGDQIKFGNEILDILHVPGHSPGSICFYNRSEGTIFVGDVLFQQSIGRTDLPGGDHHTLIEGIKSKILTLPEETVVAPGHGNLTTVGEEKRANPFL